MQMNGYHSLPAFVTLPLTFTSLSARKQQKSPENNERWHHLAFTPNKQQLLQEMNKVTLTPFDYLMSVLSRRVCSAKQQSANITNQTREPNVLQDVRQLPQREQTRRQLRDWSTKDLAIIHAAHSTEGYRCSALYTCGFSAVFLSFKCRGVKTVKIHAYMCVYAQRQKYAFLTDLSRCANAWFCFINVTVETGTCTVGELHNYPLMNVEMLFNAVCWLLRRSLCEEKVHLRGSPSASEQLSLCITVSTAAAISGPWTCTCEPSTRCYLGGCLNGVSRCILSDPIARGQL